MDDKVLVSKLLNLTKGKIAYTAFNYMRQYSVKTIKVSYAEVSISDFVSDSSSFASPETVFGFSSSNLVS